MIKILDIQHMTTHSTPVIILGQQGLRITLSIKGKQGYLKIYSGSLVSLQAQPKLQGWFQNLNELAQYMKQQDHLQIDQQTKLVKIIMKVNLNRNKVVTLAQIPLKQIKKDYKQQISHIILRCNNQQKLEQNQLKLILKKLSQIINQRMICQQQSIKNKTQNELQKKIIKTWLQQELNEKWEKKYKQKIDQIQLQLKKKYHELRYEIQLQEKSIERLIHQKMSGNEAYQPYQSRNFNRYIKQNQSFNTNSHHNLIEAMSSRDIKNQQIQQISSRDFQINHKNKIIKTQNGVKKLKKNSSSQNKEKQHLKNLFKKSTSLVNYSEREIERRDQVAKQWVDPVCYCYKNLQFKGNKITSKNPTNIFGINKIKGIFSFSINIEKIQRGIALGLIDSKYRSKSSLDNEPNWVVYWSDGQCWDGSRQKNYGRGYQQGEVVNMIGDLNEGTIEWKVDSDVRCKIKCLRLKELSIKWVPYICLWNKGDRVAILD